MLTPRLRISTAMKPQAAASAAGIGTRVKIQFQEYLGVSRDVCASSSRPTSPTPESRLSTPNLQTGTLDCKRKKVTFTDVSEDLLASTPLPLPGATCGSINSLCSTINALVPDIHTTSPHPKCLGVLENKQGDQRLRISLRGWLTFQPQGIVSLDTILNCRPKPTLRDRLKLAVSIASSMMQLYESGWLNANWGKNDISFLLGTHGPVLERPLIHRHFHDQQDETLPDLSSKDCNESESEWALAWCNPSIFYLGVILIEIWHWKSLSALQAKSGRVQRNTSPPELDTAQWLAKDLLAKAGAPYGIPVKLCIMGLEVTETQLDRECFRSEVYKKIVYPLEEHLKSFWGATDLAAIYQE